MYISISEVENELLFILTQVDMLLDLNAFIHLKFNEMKKPALILFFCTCLMFVYGQETVFIETCGNADVSSPKKIESYSGWDNLSPVIFMCTTTLDGTADIRKTTTTTNHVWFPSDKSSDLIISNIACNDYHQLILSFDIAAYKLTDANVNKLSLFCNDSALTLPSVLFPNSKFITVSNISLSNSKAVTLHFAYSAETNVNGYRLDNIRITGIKTISAISTPLYRNFNVVISGHNLFFRNLPDGTPVEIYNCSGSKVQSSLVIAGFTALNIQLTSGLYILRAGGYSCKILLFFQ